MRNRSKSLERTQRWFEHGHAYNVLVGHLGWFYDHVRDDVLDEPLPQGATVLDAGCGPGILALRILRERPDLDMHGADLAQGMIDEAVRSAEAAGAGDRVRFVQADLADLPYDDATFDLIVSSASLHHWQDIPAVMRGLARVLKPGGRLRVYDARFGVPRDELYRAAAIAFPGLPLDRTLVRRGRLGLPLVQRFGIN